MTFDVKFAIVIWVGVMGNLCGRKHTEETTPPVQVSFSLIIV
jgi:hypothetical protein